MRLLAVVLTALACPIAGATELPPALRNIIPTPQQIEPAGEPFVLVADGAPAASLVIPAEAPAQVALAARHLARRIEEACGVAVPVVSADAFAGGPALWFGEAARPHLTPEWNADLSAAQAAQEYVIAPVDGGVGYALMGPGPLGTLYAAMTILAALEIDEGGVRFPGFTCHDWPDIAWRWVGGFPHFDSVEEQFEWCMEHKINVVSSPGFYQYTTGGLDTQLAQNRFARAHGVHSLNLLFGDLGLKNRRSYPDGETYLCLDERAPSERGFCVSNAALLAEKQRLLREFVEATEPGVLYIHFVDEDDLRAATEIWLNRCEDCRARYPNDRVEAEDGKAGAQAAVFDAMCDAIFAVSHPDSGYDAARDCLVIFVSAPYTVWSEDDAAWDREVAYHCTVSRLMHHVDNVHFCIRENGLRRDNNARRCRELAEALRTRGNGHEVMMYFREGDSRDTIIGWPRRMQVPWPLLASPAMTASFEGAGSILMAGSPPALLEVEYAWNLHGDGFFLDPATEDEWRQTYVDLSRGALRPEEIFGDGGFVGRMLTHLYGPGPAAQLGMLYRPRAMEAAGGAPVPPVQGSSWLAIAREPWFATIAPERLRQYQALFEAWRGLNLEAVAAAEAALAADDLRPAGRPDLQATLQGLQVAAGLQEAAAHASGAYASLLEGDADAAEAEMAAMAEACDRAREAGTGREGRTAEIDAEERVMAAHYEALLAGADQLREMHERLTQAWESAESDRAALAAELADDAAVDPSRLAGKTIALVGGGERSEIAALLEPHGARVVPLPAAPDLPDEALTADVIVLAARSLSSAGLARLQDYVAGGGAVLLGSATPFYMVGSDVELMRIALWLGAERYGNFGGAAVPVGDTALTRGIEPDDSLQGTGSSACLFTPLGALPVLRPANNATGICVLAHRFEDGRVGYLWTLGLGEDLTCARAQVLLRMAAWLAGPA